MKYIDADKLKETIKYHIRCFEKELQHFSDEDYVCSTAAQYATEKATLENVQNIIDSPQQEQPEVDIKKEINEIWNPRFNLGWDEKSLLSINHSAFETIAYHFYELGLNAKKV